MVNQALGLSLLSSERKSGEKEKASNLNAGDFMCIFCATDYCPLPVLAFGDLLIKNRFFYWTVVIPTAVGVKVFSIRKLEVFAWRKEKFGS